ncbi:hypothetical protein [Flavobacterium sp. NKUCC04_CG]|uniref:hypothetical protein n=1 Tax=Flavobacterium sp. NKUCC04_CG TaxID=2842121 RepID=UPI001C5B6B18|nr:hypothetical protein [Flavobacterium sp. NKUCC04_CG]MBW3519962.1 hypothetical protein [Flavobacterium sp. NKUCC04_CG]
MKKFICLLSLIVLTNGVLSSCSSDDNSKPAVDETIPETTIVSSKGTYLGTETNQGKFSILLKSNDTDFQLNFISDAIADKDLLDATLKGTKYTVGSTAALYSIQADSYLKKADTQLKIVSGDVEVSKNADTYTIKGLLIDEQNTSHQINYVGLIDIEPIYEIEYEIQNGWYWGDDQYDYPNIGEYMTFFTQGQANKYGELEGDGYHISLSFFDVMAPRQWEGIKIPNKTFKASSKNELGTFHVGTKEEIDNGNPGYTFAKFLHNDSSKGIAKESFILDGTIKTMDNAKGQEIRFNIELQDGSRHIGKYTGKVKQGDEYTISTLKSDKTVGNLDQGFLEYKGKSPVQGKENNRWELYLLNENLTTYPEYYWATEGSGEYLRVALYTAVGATADIPVGVYPIGEEKAGNASTGGGTEVGLDFGTWYYEMKNDDYINSAPTRTGTVTVAKEGNNYTIKVVAVDDRDNTITANYTGALTFVNNENRPATKTKVAKATKKDYGKGKIYNGAKNFKNKK